MLEDETPEHYYILIGDLGELKFISYLIFEINFLLLSS
jgi:hypothetical protein